MQLDFGGFQTRVLSWDTGFKNLRNTTCACPISSEMEKKLEGMEMWCYRKMLRLPWTKEVTNEEVLKRVGKERTLMKSVRK